MTGSHMHDFEAHVRAVEEDLEYYRTKRLEPRVFFLARHGATVRELGIPPGRLGKLGVAENTETGLDLHEDWLEPA